jgi:hypothetical protein
MRRIIIILIAVYASCLSGTSVAQQPTQPFLFGLWEGTMTVVERRDEGDALLPPLQGEQFPFRLDIKNTNLVMYFRTQDGWFGIGEGSDLRLNQQDRSAIVIAAFPGEGTDPTETWTLNVARWNEDSIVVYLSQVTSANEGNGQPPVSFAAFGQMMRAAQDG